MSTDRELDEILAEIGSGHRTIGAPRSLEPVLFAAASGRKTAARNSGMRRAWAVAAAALLVAAIATAGVLWETRRTLPRQTRQAASLPAPHLPPRSASPSAPVKAGELAPSKKRGAPRQDPGLRDAPGKPRPWNSLDEFVALPASEGLPAAAELSVVRMTVRGSDLQQYGLQAPVDAGAQTLLAEFVVGEDGLPRAIRIVR